MPQVALVAGAVASVAGTVMSYQAQRKSAKAQQQQQDVATKRSRRQAIRQAQVARAQTVATASATGATGSSAAAAGMGSLSSQVGGELGFSTQMSSLSGDISKYSQRAATGQGIAGLGGMAMNYGFNQGATFGGIWDNLKPTSPAAATGGMTSSLRPQLRPL